MREFTAMIVAEVRKYSLEQISQRLSEGRVYREIFVELYGTLVKAKEMPAMEELPQIEKQRLWNLAKKYSGDKKRRMDMCKGIYLLEQITEMKVTEIEKIK